MFYNSEQTIQYTSDASCLAASFILVFGYKGFILCFRPKTILFTELLCLALHQLYFLALFSKFTGMRRVLRDQNKVQLYLSLIRISLYQAFICQITNSVSTPRNQLLVKYKWAVKAMTFLKMSVKNQTDLQPTIRLHEVHEINVASVLGHHLNSRHK